MGASLSRSAALTAAELSAKAVAEAGLSAGEQGKSNTLAQEKTDAVAALKKAEADKEFATGLKKKHLRGQAAQKVEKAVDCVVDKAKKNITSKLTEKAQTLAGTANEKVAAAKGQMSEAVQSQDEAKTKQEQAKIANAEAKSAAVTAEEDDVEKTEATQKAAARSAADIKTSQESP